MKIEQLLKDEAFTAKLDALGEDYAAIAGLFKDNGVEISAEEIKSELNKMDSGELTEESLDSVAGGSIASLAAIGVVALAKYLYNKLKRR